MESTLRDDLALLQSARIYFNHMSVGYNVLSGLERIGKRFGSVVLSEINQSSSGLAPSFFAHSTQGQNGAPKSKIDAFAHTLNDILPAGLDIALMKLCYVDIDRDTDVASLFKYYQTTIARLEAKHPKVAFVHVTVPLTVKAPDAGWKELIKGFIGWKDDIARANIKRAQYNILIRDTYPRKRIFDLALLESTRPDGTGESFTRYGVSYPSLYPEYTRDGGHLEGEIQERAAALLVSTLAGILRERGALAK